jgi:hypothetical protein
MVMMDWLSIEMAHYCCTWVFRQPTCISHQLLVPVLLILGCGGLSRHGCSCWPACFDGCARWRWGWARCCQCWRKRSMGFGLEVLICIHQSFRSIHGRWEIADKLLLILKVTQVTPWL